jgi:hypothetical protein
MKRRVPVDVRRDLAAGDERVQCYRRAGEVDAAGKPLLTAQEEVEE